MEDKLQNLYLDCKKELESIGIDLTSSSIGDIDISIAKRACKRYGCCKQELPIEKTKYYEKIGKRRYVKYAMYKKHHIEISKWVMDLNDDIIKNTIIHEIIHCMPNCSNHGEDFKKYAKYINYKLGYNISRVGNKNKDLIDSNIEIAKEKYNYMVQCSNCDYKFYRKRIVSNFSKLYRCGKCKGKFIVQKGIFYEQQCS